MNRQNGQVVPHGPEFRTFSEVLAFRARHQPEKTAFTFFPDFSEKGRTAVTYDELYDRVKRLAGVLCEHHLSGERAILLYPPGLDFMTAFFACLCAGVIAVPTAPPVKDRLADRLSAIIRDTDAAVILANRNVISGLRRLNLLSRLMAIPAADLLGKWLLRKTGLGNPPDCGGIPMIPTDLGKREGAHGFRPPALSGTDIAFLQYTSGSTGTPKGVMVTHKNLLHNSGLIRRATRISADSIGFNWLPIFHDMGMVTGVFHPVHAGFHCYQMSPLDFIRDPLLWLRRISEKKITHSGGPNFAYALCARRFDAGALRGVDLSSWQVAFCGAEPIQPDTLDWFAETFAPYGFRAEALMPCYGLAEATVGVCWAAYGKGPLYKSVDAEFFKSGIIAPPRSRSQARRLVGSGRANSGLEIVIVDPETGVPVPEDQVGEIRVAGDSVAGGYWHHPELSAEVFGAVPGDGHRKFLRTGDLGFISDGELYVTGRIKDLIIVRGKNHYPQDIEASVEKAHPSVRPGAVAVFSRQTSGTEALVVLLEIRPEPVGGGEDIVRAVRRTIALEHQLSPETVVLLPPRTLPKTSSGKIQRGECRVLYERNEFSAIRVWRRGRED